MSLQSRLHALEENGATPEWDSLRPNNADGEGWAILGDRLRLLPRARSRRGVITTTWCNGFHGSTRRASSTAPIQFGALRGQRASHGCYVAQGATAERGGDERIPARAGRVGRAPLGGGGKEFCIAAPAGPRRWRTRRP